MNFYGRSTTWAAAVALGIAGLIGAGAATEPAAPAPTAASAFELIVEAELIPPFFAASEGGTFRSRAPFCASGRFDEDEPWSLPRWRFTCDDGTGSLTLAPLRDANGQIVDAKWQILEGSGSYAGFRGRGSLRGEQLCGQNCDPGKPIPWRGTLQGVADRDAVAPTITLSSAKATKLPRPAGAYALRLRIGLGDNVTDNQVSYTVRAFGPGGRELARRFGTARTETVSMTLRVRPRAGARTVRLELTAEDPVGNRVSVWPRPLRLPR